MEKQEPKAPWTKAEKSILYKHFADMNNDDIAKLIPGRTANAVSKKAVREGLSKSDAFLKSECSGRYYVKPSNVEKIILVNNGPAFYTPAKPSIFKQVLNFFIRLFSTAA